MNIYVLYAHISCGIPDKFLDYINEVYPIKSNISLYPYQRVHLRELARRDETFIVGGRGTSKSYVNLLSKIIKCILVPKNKELIAAPIKKQAEQIVDEVFKDIINHFPALENEMIANIKGDYFIDDNEIKVISFCNGSIIKIDYSDSKARGTTNYGMAAEEYAQDDFSYKKFGSEIKSTMRAKRPSLRGEVDKNIIHGSMSYITNAGSPKSVAYEKMMQILKRSKIEGNNVSVMSNDWELPAMYGRVDYKQYVDQKTDVSTDIIDFERNWHSNWSGGSIDELVDTKILNYLESLPFPVLKNDHKNQWKYVLSYDVAEASNYTAANSALIVLRYRKSDNELNMYDIECVNVVTYRGLTPTEQADKLKEYVKLYDPKVISVDANGLGKMILEPLILYDNNNLGKLGIIRRELFNDCDKKGSNYDKYIKDEEVGCNKILYPLSAQEGHTKDIVMDAHIREMLIGKKVRFIDHNVNLKRLPDHVLKEYNLFTNYDEELVQTIIDSYRECQYLSEEIRNMNYDTDTRKIKPQTSGALKDRFKALEYGLWIVNQLIENELNDYRYKSASDFNFKNMFSSSAKVNSKMGSRNMLLGQNRMVVGASGKWDGFR